MKVLDLECAKAHRFEGWFASEDDFQGQLLGNMLHCPLCGSAQISKCLSAPRLNLSAARGPAESSAPVPQLPPSFPTEQLHALRQLLARTENVGDRFSEEARSMHYGEKPERNIRGQASPSQTLELLEEGIVVLPLPDILKEPMH